MSNTLLTLDTAKKAVSDASLCQLMYTEAAGLGPDHPWRQSRLAYFLHRKFVDSWNQASDKGQSFETFFADWKNEKMSGRVPGAVVEAAPQQEAPQHEEDGGECQLNVICTLETNASAASDMESEDELETMIMEGLEAPESDNDADADDDDGDELSAAINAQLEAYYTSTEESDSPVDSTEDESTEQYSSPESCYSEQSPRPQKRRRDDEAEAVDSLDTPASKRSRLESEEFRDLFESDCETEKSGESEESDYDEPATRPVERAPTPPAPQPEVSSAATPKRSAFLPGAESIWADAEAAEERREAARERRESPTKPPQPAPQASKMTTETTIAHDSCAEVSSPSPSAPQSLPAPPKARRAVTCSNCGQTGHNKKSCPNPKVQAPAEQPEPAVAQTGPMSIFEMVERMTPAEREVFRSGSNASPASNTQAAAPEPTPSAPVLSARQKKAAAAHERKLARQQQRAAMGQQMAPATPSAAPQARPTELSKEAAAAMWAAGRYHEERVKRETELARRMPAGTSKLNPVVVDDDNDDDEIDNDDDEMNTADSIIILD